MLIDGASTALFRRIWPCLTLHNDAFQQTVHTGQDACLPGLADNPLQEKIMTTPDQGADEARARRKIKCVKQMKEIMTHYYIEAKTAADQGKKVAWITSGGPVEPLMIQATFFPWSAAGLASM